MAGYIGRTPLSEAVQSRAKYTATAGQTTFSFAYQPGFIDVFLNGIKIEDTTDYAATTGTEIVLTSPATVGQVLEIIGLSTFSLVSGKHNYSATAAPAVGDDSADGYRIGSMWIDVTNDEAYRCVDDTTGAAVWIGTTLEVAEADLRYMKLSGGTLTGNLSLGDNVKAQFGAGNDLQIYHDGSSSNIFEVGTGNLTIAGTSINFNNNDLGGRYAEFISGGAAKLFHNAGEKLATTSSGIDVTGSVTCDGLAVWNGSSTDAFKMENYNRGAIWNSIGSGGMYSEYQLTGTAQFRMGNANHLVSGAATSDWALQSASGSLLFAIGTSEHMRIDSSGFVGIGTTAPDAPLTVYSTDAARYVKFKAPNGEKRFDFHIGSTGNAARLDLYTHDGTTKNVQIGSGGDTYFNGGNVGIGTSSPASKLDIDGGNGNGLVVKAANAATEYSLWSKLSNGTTALWVGGTGNVGIGTTTPAGTLDVKGAGHTYFQVTSGSESTKAFIQTIQDSDIRIGSATNHPVNIYTNGTERLRIDSSGRVGIGMIPAEVLDLKAASGDTRIRLDAASGSDTEIKFYNAGVAQYTIGHDDATDNFVIGSVNVDAPMMSVDKAGNVGIGTQTPTQKLDVTGTVKATAFVGDGSGLTGIASTLDSLADCTVSASTPTVSSNPPVVGHLWIEEDSGVVYVCTDNTPGANVWIGQNGSEVSPTTLHIFDFFGDNSAISLHQLDNSLADTGGVYAASKVCADFNSTVAAKFGSHGINTMGDGCYLDVPGVPLFRAISIWYRSIGAEDGYIVDFRHDDPGNGRSYLYTLITAGAQYVTLSSDTTKSNGTGDIYINGVLLTGQYNFIQDNWYHIVMSVNATNTGQTWDQGFRVGNRSDGVGYGNAGYFDQIRTFNRSLTQSDVDALYMET